MLKKSNELDGVLKLKRLLFWEGLSYAVTGCADAPDAACDLPIAPLSRLTSGDGLRRPSPLTRHRPSAARPAHGRGQAGPTCRGRASL
jgi:hypothetical protein